MTFDEIPMLSIFNDEGIDISCNLSQPLKAWLPILLTEGGISTLFKAMHPLKAKSSIQFNFDWLSKVILFSLLQFSKEPLPISVTEGGIETLFRNSQLEKAFKPINVTFEWNFTLVSEWQSLKVSFGISVINEGTAKVLSTSSLLMIFGPNYKPDSDIKRSKSSVLFFMNA